MKSGMFSRITIAAIGILLAFGCVTPKTVRADEAVPLQKGMLTEKNPLSGKPFEKKMPNYCSVFHSGIKKVIMSYNAKLPIEDVDWEKVLGLAARRPRQILAEGEIPIEYSSSVDASNLSLDTLYVNFVYSFAKKEGFTIQLDHDQLVTWVEIFRVIRDDAGDLKKRSKLSPKKFRDWSVDSAMEIYLSGAPLGLFENISCDVMRYSAHKACSDIKDFSKNHLVPVEKDCVVPGPEFKEIKQILESLE